MLDVPDDMTNGSLSDSAEQCILEVGEVSGLARSNLEEHGLP
jgi:hypothetical protein